MAKRSTRIKGNVYLDLAIGVCVHGPTSCIYYREFMLSKY